MRTIDWSQVRAFHASVVDGSCQPLRCGRVRASPLPRQTGPERLTQDAGVTRADRVKAEGINQPMAERIHGFFHRSP